MRVVEGGAQPDEDGRAQQKGEKQLAAQLLEVHDPYHMFWTRLRKVTGRRGLWPPARAWSSR